MPKRNAAGQDFTNNTDGFDLTGGNTSPRKITIKGGDVIISGGTTNAISINNGVDDIYLLPATSDTLIGAVATQTMTNKTLEAPNFAEYTGSTIPATPTTGITIFARNRAGRRTLAAETPAGVDYSFQPAMFSNQICYVTAFGAGATTFFTWGVAQTSYTAPAATATLVTTAGLLGSVKRAKYQVSATTTAGILGFRLGAAQWWRGNAAGLGGFFMCIRFGIPAIVSTSRLFIGLSPTTAALASAEPNTYLNSIGLIKNAADTTYQFSYSNATSTSTFSTGISVGTGSTTKLYDLRIFCAPNGSTIYFALTDIETNTTVEHNSGVGATIPTNTSFLNFHMFGSNSAAIGAVTSYAIDFQSLYVETDN